MIHFFAFQFLLKRGDSCASIARDHLWSDVWLRLKLRFTIWPDGIGFVAEGGWRQILTVLEIRRGLGVKKRPARLLVAVESRGLRGGSACSSKHWLRSPTSGARTLVRSSPLMDGVLLATLQVVTDSGASVSIGAHAERGEQSLRQIPHFQFKLDGLSAFRRPRTAMLSRGRRWYAIAAILLLAIPLVMGVIEPDDPTMILKEGRNPWPAPRLRSFTDWLWFPRCLDAYLTDHFGLRQAMIHLYRDVTDPITRPPAVLIGRGGRMFYLGDEMVKQSAGHVRRDAKVAEAADLLANMRVALARRGIAFLVAVPPNSSTIDQDDLPRWAQESRAKNGIRSFPQRPCRARSEGC